MTKRKEPHKDDLIAIGKWAAFVAHRTMLESGGMEPGAADRECVKKFLEIDLPDPVQQEAVQEQVAHNAMVARVGGDDLNRRPEPNDNAQVISSVPGIPFPVLLSAFKGKPEAGEIENITWVCDNMRIVDLNVVECPSLRAWNLLCECRESPDFRVAFWRDHYGKTIPAKSQLDSSKKGAGVDGKPTMELINRLREHSKAAKQEALACMRDRTRDRRERGVEGQSKA